jgi:PadR family transcriptional regulator PadR
MSDSERRPKSETPVPHGANKNSGARPKNWMEPAILLTLRDWNSYGYKLMEQLTVLGFEATNPGTMYRTLRHMEKNGVVKSEWETTKGGPARRVYSITQAGEAYLDLWANSLKQYQELMNTFFRLYTGGPRRQRAEEKERG